MSNRATLAPPFLLPSYVLRQSVNIALDQAATNRLLYLHSPADFGKIIAVGQWIGQKKLRCAWIPLTLYDASPLVFCRYVLAALSALDEELGESLDKILDDPSFDGAPLEYLFLGLSRISKSVQQAVIVFDDFHLIDNPMILKAFPQIVKKLPEGLLCMVISRIPPPVTFADLLLKDEIGIVSENVLLFSQNHIIKLFQNKGISLNYQEANTLREQTSGWALGLGAYLLAAQFQKDVPSLKAWM